MADWFDQMQNDWFAQQKQTFDAQNSGQPQQQMGTGVPTPPAGGRGMGAGPVGTSVTGVSPQDQVTVPTPPQPKGPKTAGGFAKNAVQSTANLWMDTSQGIADIATMPFKAIAHPIESTKAVGQAIGNLPETIPAIGGYYKNRYWDNLGDTLYEDPAGVVSDAAMLSPLAEVAATKIPALAKVAKVAGALDIPGGTMRTGAKVANKVGNVVDKTMTRYGARERNATYMKGLLNPAGHEAEKVGTRVKGKIKSKEISARKAISDQYTDVLERQGLGSQRIVREKPSHTIIHDKMTPTDELAADIISRYEGDMSKHVGKDLDAIIDYAKALEPQAFEGVPPPPRSFTAATTPEQVAIEPSFGEMHKTRGEMLGDARSMQDRAARRAKLQEVRDIEAKMQETAKLAGMEKQYGKYLDLNKAHRMNERRFNNKFIKKLVSDESVADEDIAQIFKTGKFPTFKASLSTDAMPIPRKGAVKHLKQILGPEDFKALQGGVGDAILTDISSSTNKIKGERLHNILNNLKSKGILEEVVPEHETLRKIAKLLGEDKERAFFTAPGSKSFVRDAVYVALRRLHLSDPDLQRAVNRLQKSKNPAAQKLWTLLTKSANPLATAERIDDNVNIPEPPQR